VAMQERGRMQQGMVADIAIFNPATVTDHATYKFGEHGLPSSGIPYVIVNGQLVVKESKFQKVWAGQPIRFPIRETGQFKPVTEKDWVQNFSISTITIDDSGAKPAGGSAEAKQ